MPLLDARTSDHRFRQTQANRFLLGLIPVLLCGGAASAQVVITPGTPAAVNAGGTVQFTANVPVSWSMAPGSQGTINATTGLYTAPPSVTAKQSLGGCQLLPNNHIYNTRIDNLPVHPSSAIWLTVAHTGSINYLASFPLNSVDASTPVQNMVFAYTPKNNGPFEIPPYPNIRMESGWFTPPFGGMDRHIFAVDTGTCIFQEMYNYYPAGTNTYNNCPACTSQSGVRYAGTNYQLAVNGGTDAASLYILPLSLHLQEVLNAVATGGTINHALRVTMPAGWISSSFIWPAMAMAPNGGAIPYGARFRLKSSFNISTFSPTAQVLLKQLQQYGVILADVGLQWQINIDADRPLTLRYGGSSVTKAFDEVTAAVTPANLEAVDESSLMLSASTGDTKVGAETVMAAAVNGGATAQQRVVLTGVTIGVPIYQKYIQAGSPALQLTAWVQGSSNTGVTWSMNPAVGTLTAGGLYTPPATAAGVTSTTVTATANADATVSAQMSLTILPTGTVRIIMGQTTPYTDSQGNVWMGETGDDGGWPYANGGTWPSVPDIQLYKTPWWDYGDMRFDFWVANGNYLVTSKFAANMIGSGAGVFSLETQGQVLYPSLDMYVMAGGQNKPIDYKLPAKVTNNQLSFVLRHVTGSVVFVSALQIERVAGNATTATPPSPLSLTATPQP